MPALLTLAQARQQINVTDTAEQVEMQAFIDATVEMVENLVGPVEPRVVVDHFRRGSSVILSTIPVLSIDAVAVLQPPAPPSPVDITSLHFDPRSGVVQLQPYGPVAVTYTAGRTSVPAAVNLAARIIFEHLWSTQRRDAVRGVGRGGGDPAPQGMGYALPNRAAELLAAHKLPPAVA